MSDRKKLIGEIISLHQGFSRSARHFPHYPWMNLNLTIGQLKSLFLIEYEGVASVGRLASTLGVTPPSASGIVERLVEQGLVGRGENPDDRRTITLSATTAGKDLLAKLRETGTSRMSEMLAELDTEELESLRRGYAALARAAEGLLKKDLQ